MSFNRSTVIRSFKCLLVAGAISGMMTCDGCRKIKGMYDSKTERCATVAPLPDKREAIETRLRALPTESFTPRASGSVEIKVYFHIIMDSDGQGDVTDDQVAQQIQVLNDAYAGVDPRGGSPTPFKFKLETVDRYKNHDWFTMSYQKETPTTAELEAKQLNQGDPSALNIYTIGLVRPFGWARFPWELSKKVDGVVISYMTLPGGSNLNYNLGKTAVHEVGHWLGLFHTYENGCDGDGDSVYDTPAEKYPAYGCPDSPNTCPTITGYDPVENFMDNTYDSCMYRFSQGQATRMDQMYFEYRTLPGSISVLRGGTLDSIYHRASFSSERSVGF